MILSLFAVLSCTKVQHTSLRVNVFPNIEGGRSDTKGVITSTNFLSGNTFGQFVYHAEDGQALTQFNSYGSRYENINATKESATVWSYTLNGSSSSFRNFFLINPSADNQGELAICAYAPYIKGASRIDKVPFTIGGKHSEISDLMWAEQNSGSSNLQISPNGNNVDIELYFKHALSMIKLQMKCLHSGSTMRLSSVRIVSKGQTPLYGGGSFNAVNGTFNAEDMKEVVSVEFSGEKKEAYMFDSSMYKEFPILIVPTEYMQNGDYEIVFTFNDNTLKACYAIQKNDVKVTKEVDGVDVDCFAFEQGKVYTFKFDFDNYAQITNVKVAPEGEWGLGGKFDLEF